VLGSCTVSPKILRSWGVLGGDNPRDILPVAVFSSGTDENWPFINQFGDNIQTLVILNNVISVPFLHKFGVLSTGAVHAQLNWCLFTFNIYNICVATGTRYRSSIVFILPIQSTNKYIYHWNVSNKWLTVAHCSSIKATLYYSALHFQW
jgi:hypothetical protein